MRDLPKAIATYLATDPGDTDTVAHCFTEDATVRDEGKTHTGRAAIGAWRAKTATEYQYTSTPIAARGLLFRKNCTEESGLLTCFHRIGRRRLSTNVSSSPRSERKAMPPAAPAQ